jgi:hypothetical protein
MITRLHRVGHQFKTAFFAVAKKPGKKIQMTERHLNWILLRKIRRADESLVGPTIF